MQIMRKDTRAMIIHIRTERDTPTPTGKDIHIMPKEIRMARITPNTAKVDSLTFHQHFISLTNIQIEQLMTITTARMTIIQDMFMALTATHQPPTLRKATN